jgi:RNA polymerase sigma-70 factor, ECF subfamily
MARMGDGPETPAGEESPEAALAQLYPIVRKHLGFLLGFHPLTEDAVQESMLAIYRALPGFRGQSTRTTWALAIASRIGRRYLRRERRLSAAPGELASLPEGFEPPAESAELLLLVQCLERLAPKKREAFILMAIFELSATEAAAVLGTFANTAASRYRHARSELHDLLSDAPEIPASAPAEIDRLAPAVRKERRAR